MLVELSNQSYFSFDILVNGRTFTLIFKKNTRDKTYYFTLNYGQATIINNAPVIAGYDYIQQVAYKLQDVKMSLWFKRLAFTGDLSTDYIMEYASDSAI